MEEDSCYEESDYDESSRSEECNSDSYSDGEEVESIFEKTVEPLLVDDNVTISESQDYVGQSSTQNLNGDSPLVDGEVMPPTNEEDTNIAIPYKGQMFNTWEEAKAFYSEYARKIGFGVRTRDSRRDKARDNSVTRVTLTCDREGRHVPRVKPKDPEKLVVRRNTSTQKCGCPARVILVVCKDGTWVVNEFHGEHNHDPNTPSK